MPTLRKRSRTLETPGSPNHNSQINNAEFITQLEKTLSGYEESREKRIKENLERLQKLGIRDLSLKLKSSTPSNKLNNSGKKTPIRHSPLQHLSPTRRSSRLQNVTPVSPVEVHKAKKEGSLQDEDILMEDGLQTENYTEKHEKLLSFEHHKKEFHLFALEFIRYGENLLEAKQNPNLGSKSVAHYLNETRPPSPENSGSNPGTKTPLSTKKSLPFSDMEAPPVKVNDDLLGVSKPQSEDKRNAEFKVEENMEMHFPDNGDCNNQINNGIFVTQLENTVSWYEESRQKRIKENLERMQKLGIMDLSLKLKSCTPSNKRSYSVKKTPNGHSPLQFLAPTRRSSRLQNGTPVSNVEMHKAKKEGSLQDEDILLGEGLTPEIYTEKNEELLGDCKTSWTLLVDGYRKVGNRIYDSIKGKTCHQCRQKTLGHRTHCSQCNMLQGQFCGDCLYTRYGENLFEAKQNPNWICSVCRGICNCSFCRKAKGLAPTGHLYRKVANLGFKSVAHYLNETRRHSLGNSGSNPGTKIPPPAKRSLPFSDMEAPPAEVNDHHLGVSKPQSENKRDAEFKFDEHTEMHFTDNGDCNIAPGNSQKNKESPAAIEPSLDSIAGRPRSRDTKEKFHDREELTEETLDVNPEANNSSAGTFVSEMGSELFTAKVIDESKDTRDYAITINGKEEDGLYILYNTDSKIELESSPRKQKPTSALEPSPDSIGGRLRKRRMEEKRHEGEEDDGPHIIYNTDSKIELESAPRKQKRTSAHEPNPDSIGGRLRHRRKEEKSHEGKELVVFSEETMVANKTLDIILSKNGACSNLKLLDLIEPCPDSIAGRLRSRRKIT